MCIYMTFVILLCNVLRHEVLKYTSTAIYSYAGEGSPSGRVTIHSTALTTWSSKGT